MTKPVILCVDDERIILDALRTQLQHALQGQYRIELAESGEEALEIIEELEQRKVSLPLVIVDQMMNGMSGDALLVHIKERLPDTLSIMLTGQASAEAVGRAVNKAGLFRYLSKPWQENDLLMTVRAAMDTAWQRELVKRQTAYQKILNEILQLGLRRGRLREHMAQALAQILTAPDLIGGGAGAIYITGDAVPGEQNSVQPMAEQGDLKVALPETPVTEFEVKALDKRGELSVYSIPILADGQNRGLLQLQCRRVLEHEEGFKGFCQSVAHSLAGMVHMAGYYDALEAEVAARTDELHDALRRQARQNESLQSLNRELEYYATTDELTGLCNRRCFFERADKEVARAVRYDHATVLAMLDVDHFKEVNDRYGHQVGDEVLRAVARIVRDNIRSHDIVGRVGGEEFAIVMPETTATEGRELCERLRRAVSRAEIQALGQLVSVTVSMGLSAIGEMERGVSGAMLRADQALYDAKHKGRDQIATA